MDAAEIEDCIIGLRSHIKRGSVLRHTVMLGNHFYMPPSIDEKPMPRNFWIGENCLIEKAIIDEYVQIGNNVRLVNQKGLMDYDGKNGVYIRDGIVIVTAGTVLPDNYIL